MQVSCACISLTGMKQSKKHTSSRFYMSSELFGFFGGLWTTSVLVIWYQYFYMDVCLFVFCCSSKLCCQDPLILFRVFVKYQSVDSFRHNGMDGKSGWCFLHYGSGKVGYIWGRTHLSDHVMKMHNESLVYIWKIQFRKSPKWRTCMYIDHHAYHVYIYIYIFFIHVVWSISLSMYIPFIWIGIFSGKHPSVLLTQHLDYQHLKMEFWTQVVS